MLRAVHAKTWCWVKSACSPLQPRLHDVRSRGMVDTEGKCAQLGDTESKCAQLGDIGGKCSQLEATEGKCSRLGATESKVFTAKGTVLSSGQNSTSPFVRDR